MVFTRTSYGADLVARTARRMGDGPVLASWTGRSEGDLRQIGLTITPRSDVFRVRQTHGNEVVVVDSKDSFGPSASSWSSQTADSATAWRLGEDGLPPEGDALVTSQAGARLCVLVADCAAVALGSRQGVAAAVHVGWKGLAAGILEKAVDVMRSMGATEVSAGLGPCIHPCCYAFSVEDLDPIVQRYGPSVRAKTSLGQPALDLPEGVRLALDSAGIPLLFEAESCTGCSSGFFSHRTRGEPERQALFVWNEG